MELKTLTEMGIQHPEEITHYNFRQKTKREDELEIRFERKKGSLRAASRSYVFGRSMKTIVIDSGSASFEDTYEISPFALTAMEELDNLLKITQPNLTTLKQLMMLELDSLDTLIGKDDTDHEMKERLSKLRKHISKLE